MASNNKHPKTDPADLTRRVWVIEARFKGERRMRRRERRDRIFAKAANALNAIVQMQKFIN